MSGKAIPCEDCTVHLGISRHVKEKANIEEKINLGRKTAYQGRRRFSKSGTAYFRILRKAVFENFIRKRFVGMLFDFM